MQSTIYKTIATFFGLGYAPIAPGTFGALGGVLISSFLIYFGLSFEAFQWVHLILIAIAYMLGVWACKGLNTEWGDDPSRVVIDETLGFWIAILFLPLTWKVLLGGFILFRFFDILKPFGIRKLDQWKNPNAVMLDDVAAGIYANIVLQLLFYSFPNL